MLLSTPYNIPFVQVFLCIYFTYGESKRAGNGWRVCRTCNFSFTRKIAGARAYWGRHIEKGELENSPLFTWLYRSFADEAFLPCNTRLLKKYLLRIYFTYGKSKRAGNGWPVCRTRNFSRYEKLRVRGPIGGAT